MSTVIAPPVWDMSPFFPSLSSPEYAESVQEIKSKLVSAASFCDAHGIQKGAEARSSDSATLQELIQTLNHLSAHLRLLDAFVYGFLAVDTTNEEAQVADSRLNDLRSSLSQLEVRIEAWVGSRSPGIEESSDVAREHTYWIQKARVSAGHQMTYAEEALAAELSMTGINAWSKLHGDLTSQIKVTMNGEVHTMNDVRNMAYSPERDVRKSAYEAELAAWPASELVCAAAMNAIKSEAGVLARRRGWTEPLESAVEASNISRPALEAMMGASREAFPAFRRYMQAKAKLISGDDRLPWFDIFAPVGKDQGSWEYEEGIDFVARQFSTFSPRMGEFARRAHRENWVDARPAPAKVGAPTPDLETFIRGGRDACA
jgi:oligoendopeptidase F